MSYNSINLQTFLCSNIYYCFLLFLFFTNPFQTIDLFMYFIGKFVYIVFFLPDVIVFATVIGILFGLSFEPHVEMKVVDYVNYVNYDFVKHYTFNCISKNISKNILKRSKININQNG